MGGALCKTGKVGVEEPRNITLPDVGVICVTVCKGEFFKVKSEESNDPFFVVTLGTRTFRTKTIRDRKAVWNQKIVIPLESPQINYKLKISLYDRDDFSGNDFLASQLFDVEALIKQAEFDQCVEMKTPKDELVAKIDLKVQFLSKIEVVKRFWRSLASIFDSDRSNYLDRLPTTSPILYEHHPCITTMIVPESIDIMFASSADSLCINHSAELASLLESMGNVMTDAEIEELFVQTDKSGDGKLQYDEFVEGMSKRQDLQKLSLQRDPITNKPISSSGEETLARMVAYVDGNDDTEIVVSRFLSEEHATKGWASRLVAGTNYKEEEICEQSEFVQFMERKTGEVKQELIPTYIKLAMRIMYSEILGKLKTDAKRVQKLLAHMTKNLGVKYNNPASKKEIANFIKYHKLDVNEILDPVDSFPNFNEFFYRKLKSNARPLAEPQNPSDIRTHDLQLPYSIVQFPQLIAAASSSQRSHKQQEYDKNALHLSEIKVVSHPKTVEQAAKYDDGSLVISRLAPQDYHRFHCPVDCTIKSIKTIEGAYYTVNPIAIRQKFDVYTENKRLVAILDSPLFGEVAYIMIGATMVGSIVPTVQVGATIKKGDEIGYFAFGGSTVVSLFMKDKIRFDSDLESNSSKPLETRVFMGESLGTSLASPSS